MGFLTQLQAMGLRVVLLTSPVFPRVAIEERLVWAGLEGFPFDWISSFEVVHAAKPHPAYYREAATTLGIEPQHWLMVGNDLDADIRPAVATGMQAWWVNGQELPDDLRGKVHQGTLQQLLELLAASSR
jgi:FMN phosphatase YigB (HAD superfamily)